MKNSTLPVLIISLIILVGYSVVQGLVLTTTLPQTNHDIILRTLGTMDMLVGSVAGFWLGSSIGSRVKDNRTIIDVKGKQNEEISSSSSAPSSSNGS